MIFRPLSVNRSNILPPFGGAYKLMHMRAKFSKNLA